MTTKLKLQIIFNAKENNNKNIPMPADHILYGEI